ncbi:MULTISPECIES: PIG-L deacetylase family protein [unclassified Brevundimonas]|uniref:PIG-L deacetylase family protein n=1 Tax=unclassified Brevundimonas TaxID=2622653 RepID=UPI003F8FD401
MTTLVLLAHYDDEYCAIPLLVQARDKGEPLLLAFNAVPRTPDERTKRLHETTRCLDALGITQRIILGDGGARAFDGQLLHGLEHVFAALLSALPPSSIDGIITPAWEGGHIDHDMCAVLGVALSAHLARGSASPCPVVQFSLYNGADLPGPLFHGARPLPENGPLLPVSIGRRDWLAFAAAVRFYPSQAGVWSTLWPAVFLSYAQRGFSVQRLSQDRVRQRPHAGPLLYERRGRPSYAMVSEQVATFLSLAGDASA